MAKYKGLNRVPLNFVVRVLFSQSPNILSSMLAPNMTEKNILTAFCYLIDLGLAVLRVVASPIQVSKGASRVPRGGKCDEAQPILQSVTYFFWLLYYFTHDRGLTWFNQLWWVSFSVQAHYNKLHHNCSWLNPHCSASWKTSTQRPVFPVHRPCTRHSYLRLNHSRQGAIGRLGRDAKWPGRGWNPWSKLGSRGI